MKKIFMTLAVFIIATTAVFSQKITTASDYFKMVSDYYSTIKDYEADIEISLGKNPMTGRVSFKRPEMLRIDFSDPAEQVILFNGDDLTIYLPNSSAILQQSVKSVGSAAPTAGGLNLMRRYYSVAYESGQSAEPLDPGSDEMVINLVLYARSSTEAFTKLRLSIGRDDKLIRRVEATNRQGDKTTFDITNYKLNTNIAEQRFIYEPPSSANAYNNFLFAE